MIEDEIDLDVFGRDVPHRGQGPSHVANDIQRRRVGALRDRNVDGALVVDVRKADDDIGRVLDRPDISQIHGWTRAETKRRVE